MDEISYEHFKSFDLQIITALCKWIAVAIPQGKIPEELLQVLVRPMTKRAGEEAIRPISLFSTLLKLIDRIFLKRLKVFLEEKKLVDDNQYGFQRKKSAQDCVGRLILDIQQLKESKAWKSLFLISFDMSKAYDKVNNQLLYQRLIFELDVPKSWHRYLFLLLFQRKVAVQTLFFRTEWRLFQFGIGQGLPSAPLLFNLFIDPVLKKVKRLVHKEYAFADDLTAIQGYSSVELAKAQLPILLQRISKLYTDVDAELNIQKSVVIPLSNYRTSFQDSLGSLIQVKTEHKILGIVIDNRTKFIRQVDYIESKCKLILTWLRQRLQRLDSKAASKDWFLVS